MTVKLMYADDAELAPLEQAVIDADADFERAESVLRECLTTLDSVLRARNKTLGTGGPGIPLGALDRLAISEKTRAIMEESIYGADNSSMFFKKGH